MDIIRHVRSLFSYETPQEGPYPHRLTIESYLNRHIPRGPIVHWWDYAHLYEFGASQTPLIKHHDNVIYTIIQAAIMVYLSPPPSIDITCHTFLPHILRLDLTKLGDLSSLNVPEILFQLAATYNFKDRSDTAHNFFVLLDQRIRLRDPLDGPEWPIRDVYVFLNSFPRDRQPQIAFQLAYGRKSLLTVNGADRFKAFLKHHSYVMYDYMLREDRIFTRADSFWIYHLVMLIADGYYMFDSSRLSMDIAARFLKIAPHLTINMNKMIISLWLTVRQVNTINLRDNVCRFRNVEATYNRDPANIESYETFLGYFKWLAFFFDASSATSKKYCV